MLLNYIPSRCMSQFNKYKLSFHGDKLSSILGITVLINNLIFIFIFLVLPELFFNKQNELAYYMLMPFFSTSAVLSFPVIFTLIKFRPRLLKNELLNTLFEILIPAIVIIAAIYPILIIASFVIVNFNIVLAGILVAIPLLHYAILRIQKKQTFSINRKYFNWNYFSLSFQVLIYYFLTMAYTF